jgi:hypothetical protein
VIVDRETSEQDGNVHIDVPDGVYSLIARGSDGFAVARSVLAGVDNETLVLGLCPPVDMPVVESILQNDVYGRGTVANVGEEIDPAGWFNVLWGAGFELRADGTVSGRITRTEDLGELPRGIENSRVLFIRAGAIVAEGRTNESGEFELSGLNPGPYSFVAASNLGMVALAVEIRPTIGVASTRGTEVSFVSFDDDSTPHADIAPPGDIQAAGGTAGGPGAGPGVGIGGMAPFGPLGPPPFGAGGGGGFGGGGSFGGGGGGLGGGGIVGPLLAGLGGAALGWALADDDDDDKASP